MSTETTKKRSIRKRLYAGLLLMSIAIVIFTSISVAIRHYRFIEESYTERAYDIIDIVCDVIEADRIPGYIASGEKDDYYDEFYNFMNTVAHEADLRYFYIFVPEDDGATYIWDTSGWDEEANTFLESVPYDKNDQEIAYQIMGNEYPRKIHIVREIDNVWIAAAFAPVIDKNGQPVAIVGMDMRVKDFMLTITGYFVSILVSVMALIFVTVYVFVRYLKKNFLEPINVLSEATTHMVENMDSEEQFVHAIHTGDEIEDLADSFQTMEKELREYISENIRITSERERINAELDLAAQIQEGMLPTDFPAFPDCSEFDLYATMNPAKTVCGDFYDFFMTDEDHIALVMADVSGKGISAALFMAISKAIIKNRALAGGSPAQILTDVNNQLARSNTNAMFVTVWLAIVDLRTGKGLAANAGHEHPALRRGYDGQFELSVYSHSIVVGVIENTKYEEHEFELKPGDAIFVYTDGVPEAINNADQLFGLDRMIAALNEPADSPEACTGNVKRAIEDFVQEADQFDDITMMIFEYFGVDKANDTKD